MQTANSSETQANECTTVCWHCSKVKPHLLDKLCLTVYMSNFHFVSCLRDYDELHHLPVRVLTNLRYKIYGPKNIPCWLKSDYVYLFVYLQSLIIGLIGSSYSVSKDIEKFGFCLWVKEILVTCSCWLKVLSGYDNLKF